MKAIIIDDEAAGRDTLEMMLTEFCPGVTLVAKVENLEDAVSVINHLRPALLFMDIELNRGTGFDVLDRIQLEDYSVIFTTAYDQYAIKAFKYSTIDYLLKPIDVNELIKAVGKAAEYRRVQRGIPEQIRHFLETMKEPEKPVRLFVNTSDSAYSIDTKEIIHLRADVNYTHIFLSDGERITATKPLKEFEEILGQDDFLRIHQSHLVNRSYIKKYMKSDGGYLVMSNGTKLEVSTRKKVEILTKLQQF